MLVIHCIHMPLWIGLFQKAKIGFDDSEFCYWYWSGSLISETISCNFSNIYTMSNFRKMFITTNTGQCRSALLISGYVDQQQWSDLANYNFYDTRSKACDCRFNMTTRKWKTCVFDLWNGRKNSQRTRTRNTFDWVRAMPR